MSPPAALDYDNKPAGRRDVPPYITVSNRDAIVLPGDFEAGITAGRYHPSPERNGTSQPDHPSGRRRLVIMVKPEQPPAQRVVRRTCADYRRPDLP